MTERGRACTILVVSSTEKFEAFVRKELTERGFGTIEVRKSASLAQRALLERPYNIVIVNTPLSDETGIDLAIDISERYTAGVVLAVAGEVAEDVADRVTDHGIIVIPKPVTRIVVSRSVRLLCALQEKLADTQKKIRNLEERMEEIRIVNRAKWVLIENEMISEKEAHRRITKEAMDRCVSKRIVAEEIIDRYRP